MASLIARAQNSYMLGSTSPSSLIQTACFLPCLGTATSVAVVAELSVMAFSMGVESCAVLAKENAASNRSADNMRIIDFIPLIYQVFVEKMMDLS